jgi:hypothetical protein
MYQSPADALMGLVTSRGRESELLPWTLKTTEELRKMRNGIDYFFVEVTFSNGTQYGIHAYGEEAEELQHQAHVLQSEGEHRLLPVIIS